MDLGWIQPLVKMSTRNIPGGKGGRCVRLTTSPPSCAPNVMKIRETKPSGTLWVTPGLLRDYFILHDELTCTWNMRFGNVTLEHRAR